MKLAAVAVAFLAAASGLFADVVHLKSGKRHEGAVSRDEASGTVTVKKPNGIVVKIREDDVAREPGTDKLRIVRSETLVDAFNERFTMTPAELGPLVELANWAQEKRLRTQLRKVCRKILTIDPNNEMAREALGYVVFENVWVPESELKKNRLEKGLVKFRGAWMKADERNRRLLEEAQREIADLFGSVASKNKYVREFSIRKLMSYKGEHGRAIFASYLDDPRDNVRIVAASSLTNFSSRHADPHKDPEAQAITQQLFEAVLNVESPEEIEALYLALRLFQPAESFRLGLGFLQRSSTQGDDVKRHRASEVVFQSLKKSWIPAVCGALTFRRNGETIAAPAVRTLLKRALKVDFEYDVDRWLKWWKANQDRFRDEP